jgi:hypothetical protein
VAFVGEAGFHPGTGGGGGARLIGQVRIAQAFLDFRHEIVAEFDIDLAEPRLDLLCFKLGGERLDELFVFCAVRKKDFHPVADPLATLSLRIAMKGRLPASKKRHAKNLESTELNREPPRRKSGHSH